MFEFISFAYLAATITAGIDKVPLEIKMLVDIPRSGMIPAYMIGFYRNTTVLDLPSFLSDQAPDQGRRKIGSEQYKANASRVDCVCR